MLHSLSRCDELAFFLGIVRPASRSRLAAMRLSIARDSRFELWPEMTYKSLEGPGECFS